MRDSIDDKTTDNTAGTGKKNLRQEKFLASLTLTLITALLGIFIYFISSNTSLKTLDVADVDFATKSYAASAYVDNGEKFDRPADTKPGLAQINKVAGDSFEEALARSLQRNNILTANRPFQKKPWHIDAHLEKLVDKQIRSWGALSPRTGGKMPIDNVREWVSRVSIYRDYIAEAAVKYSIDMNFLVALFAWESGGKPSARSSKNATGFGQFMSYTARAAGLIVNDAVDERLDPSKAIFAAASYISEAAKRHYKYSFLVTAHYNFGPGNLRQRINQYGMNENLFYALPKETRKHYINIFAIKKLLDNREEYGFTFQLLPSFKEIIENSRDYVIKKGDHLKKIAKENSLDIDMILFKNPQIVNPDRIPTGTRIKI